jgi:poly(3-hydroxybutyrate) depolymerase
MPGDDPATTLGAIVRNANPGYAGPWPRVQVFHGANDLSASPSHLTAIMKQWTDVHGIDQTPDEVTMLENATVQRYRHADGSTRVETYSIAAMGHGVAIDPGAGPTQCGVEGLFYFDEDFCAAYLALQFWGIAGGAEQPD